MSASHHQSGAEDDIPLQDQLHELQQQMQQIHQDIEEIHGRIQQTSQEAQGTQQQMRDDIDTTLQSFQQLDQQTQHFVQQLGQHFDEAQRTTLQSDIYRQQREEVLRQQIEETQRTILQSDLHRQQREEVLQTSLQQLQRQVDGTRQKMQQVDHEAQDSREKLIESQLQVQQQVKEALEKIQKMGQQAQHSQQQQFEKMQQQIREAEKVSRPQDLTPQGLLSQEDFNQFLHAQYCVQSVLMKPIQGIPFPRLFIILPEPTTVAGGQGRPCALQFRLHFLCECAAHTIPRHHNNPHEAHLTKHPGYNLDNQSVFIYKYGSYLLTMMYMVKYGARVGGLVVPPFLGLNRAIEDRGHLQSIKNISRLVDDTITHLQEANGSVDNDVSTPRSLNAIEFTELKSHLKVKDGECSLGGLSQMEIQRSSYTSICSDHLRYCYDSALQQLKRDINTNASKWNGVEIKVIATSEAMIKLSNDALGKLLKVQHMKYWPPVTTINLRLEDHHSTSSSTRDIFGILNGFGSLSLDFGRLKIKADGVSQDDVKGMSIEIHDLRDLTLNDLDFIQQYRPIALAISKAPEKDDDSRLVSILQHNPSIMILSIECHMGRYAAVINLVQSTREDMLKGGSRPELRILLQHDSKKRVDGKFENTVEVRFEGYGISTTETELKCHQFKTADPEECDFLRQYGWSIKTLVAPGSFSDHLAKLLNESTQERGSRIASIDITPTSLTAAGLISISQVINRSKGLTNLRLSLRHIRQQPQLEKALLLLEQYKDRVTSVHMSDWCEESCLSQIKRVLPDRSRFPRLEEFSVDCMLWKQDLRDIARQWITSMISSQSPHRTPLKVLKVKINLQREDWEAVIKAINHSTLEELHINNCYFPQERLRLLVDYIVDSGVSSLPLRVLNLKGTDLKDNYSTRAMFARIEEKAPQVEILK